MDNRTKMNFSQSPFFDKDVKNGSLPPVEERLPINPLIVKPWEQIGSYGGEMTYAEINPRFCHYMRHINEAPLLEIGESRDFHHYSRMDGPIGPGIFESFEVDQTGQSHTFIIRKGIRWSDGIPVTTQDVLYAVKDVLQHPQIHPFLTNSEDAFIMLPEWEWLNWGEEKVKLDVLDDYTFRLFFAKPYHSFVLQQVRNSRWQMLLRPAHYLKQYHEYYADTEKLRKQMEEKGFSAEDWGRFYNEIDPAVREAGYFLPARIPEIWKYPTLDPWVYEEGSNIEWGFLRRNPYYYAVDTKGNQLPYIDKIKRHILPDVQVLRQSVEEGKVSFSSCFLKITDAPVYKQKEKENGYCTMLLRLWQIQQVVLLINLCPKQENLRPIVQDVRFRQALSLSMNREEMQDKLFLGYGVKSQMTAGREKPYYQEKFAASYVEYNVKQANMLLDSMGLSKKNEDGIRYLNEKELIELQLVYYLVTPMADEAVALINEYFKKIGIKLVIIRLSHGSEMGSFQSANQHIFSVWEMSGDDPLIPYQVGGLSDPVPLWWKWYETGGREGVEPVKEAMELYQLRDQLKSSNKKEERIRIAGEIYRLQAENLWIIGTVAEVPQPFVYSNKLKNISSAEEKGYFTSTVLCAARQWYLDENHINRREL